LVGKVAMDLCYTAGMPHIHTADKQYDLCTCAFIVRTDTPEPTIMLHKHVTLGMLMQFGGHVELNENPWQAIAHELREESGYELSDLLLLQPQTRFAYLSGSHGVAHPIPATVMSYRYGDLNHLHTDLVYVFTTDHAPRLPVAKGESTELRCLTRTEIETLPEALIPQDIRAIALFALDILTAAWEAVPASDWSLEPAT
jgi:8-oxo-dGTP diphosphatase